MSDEFKVHYEPPADGLMLLVTLYLSKADDGTTSFIYVTGYDFYTEVPTLVAQTYAKLDLRVEILGCWQISALELP